MFELRQGIWRLERGGKFKRVSSDCQGEWGQTPI